MPDELVLLVNPAARAGRAVRLLSPVLDRLRQTGRPVSVITGESAADALARAREAVARRPGALVAFGGDGMVHLAVQAVAGTGVPLGIIPVGTGNDIADALGIPRRSPLAAADVVTGGQVRAFDAGRIRTAGGEEWFASVVACGFDSRVNERANRMTRPQSMARYLVAMVQELRAFTPIPFRITIDDGEVIEREAMLVAVANTRSYGAGMRVCPAARPDDGRLDLLILGAVSKAEFLQAFPRVYRGSHVDHPAVTIRRAARVTVEAPDVVAYADGERMGPLPAVCAVEPAAIRVIVPKESTL